MKAKMRQEAIQNENVTESRPLCRVVWRGQMDYQEAWDLQRTLAAQRLAGEIPDTLLLLEHPPTITIGRSGKDVHIMAAPEALERQGIALVESDRGGDVTYHGPGQLVGYPILNLQAAPHRPDLHAYLRALEETLIRALAAFGITAGRFPGYTGVWTGMETPHPEKVAAIGVRVSRWITSHGFALNICPDLAHFDLIVPCGIRDYRVTSLSRLLDREVSVAEVLPVVQSAFAEVFGFDEASTR
ncbi:MAG TPA: lipoyl(octanoyl) transferase LipB [Chthonomonadaceae bacterium]|nr:lipoyl(octanoyl) transferase LipB [Chthonomonadaceae bacterium]